MSACEQELDVIATAYFAALMAGDHSAALLLIQQVQAEGVPLGEVYRSVLQPALYEVGRLWERGELDIANEHAATAATRRVMERCFAPLKAVSSAKPQILATCVGPELHDVGIRMVADCFELCGWPTLYLGSNMPPEAIVPLAVRHQVAVVAISVTMSRHLRQARSLIRALRQSSIGDTVKILVGGQPFNYAPNLWQRIGADGTAPDAIAATAWVDHHVRLHAYAV